MSESCGHCGRPGVGTYERGYGFDAAGTPLCHPNDDGPDCYTLVTRDRHTTPCARCEPWDERGIVERRGYVAAVWRGLRKGARIGLRGKP